MLKAFIRSRLGQALVSRLIARAMRTPYFHLFHDDGRPYMERYWLLRLGLPRGWRELDKRRRYLLAVLDRQHLIASVRGQVEAELADLQTKLHPKFGIRLHRIMSSDDRAFHDHPWDFTTLILRGGYTEFTPDWTQGPTPAHVSLSEDYDGHVPETYLHVNGRYYGAGTLLRRKAENWHFLVLPKGDEAWTMFCTGEKKQTWGFLVDGLVKVPYRIYLQRRRERVAAAAEAKVFARGVDA